MDSFPAFFPLRGKRVVIAGDGEPAEAKARLLAGAPCVVVRLGRDQAIEASAYADADLVFVASWDAGFRAAAAEVARSAGAPVNVVDAPELSDFHTPAIIDRGPVVAAIGTTGASPLMASLLRSDLERLIPEGAGRIAAMFADRREAIRAAFPDLAQRRAFLRRVLVGPAVIAAQAGDMEAARASLDRAIAEGWTALGKVGVIETGGAPDLISLRAARLLAEADLILASAGAGLLLANQGRRDAERLDIGAADADFLAAAVGEGKIAAVVSETIDAYLVDRLRAKGVAVEVLMAAGAS